MYSSRASRWASFSGYSLLYCSLTPGFMGISWSHSLCSGSPVSSSSWNSCAYCRYSSGIAATRIARLPSSVLAWRRYIMFVSFRSLELRAAWCFVVANSLRGSEGVLVFPRSGIVEPCAGSVLSQSSWPVVQSILGLYPFSHGRPKITSWSPISVISSTSFDWMGPMTMWRGAVSVVTYPFP